MSSELAAAQMELVNAENQEQRTRWDFVAVARPGDGMLGMLLDAERRTKEATEMVHALIQQQAEAAGRCSLCGYMGHRGSECELVGRPVAR